MQTKNVILLLASAGGAAGAAIRFLALSYFFMMTEALFWELTIYFLMYASPLILVIMSVVP